MIRKNIAGDQPQIDSTAFVDPSAVVIGRVIIGANTYIGPGVVLRADRFSTVDDISKIEIGSNCSIQDIAVIHSRAETPISIKDDTSISHGVIIHGATAIGRGCFVGARSIITNSMIEDSVYIKTNAIVENVHLTREAVVPNNAVIESQDMTVSLRKTAVREKDFMQKCIAENREFAMRYKYSLTD